MIRAQATALLVLAIAIAGAVVAVRSQVGSLAVLFGVIGATSVAGLRRKSDRRLVHLRPDLARWLDQVSAVTGEPVDDVLDRSVSAYRASMRRGSDG
jgi:Flp pilus assembly protein TadB